MPNTHVDINRMKTLLGAKHLYTNGKKDLRGCVEYLKEKGAYSQKSNDQDCAFMIDKYIDLILTIRDAFKEGDCG